MHSPFTAQQLIHLLDLIPANIYWEDIDGRMLGCNQANLKALGLNDYKQVFGKIVYELLPSSFNSLVAPVKEVDKYVKESNNEVILQERGLNSAGQETIYLSKKKPLVGTYNQLCGMIGISIDLSIISSRSEQKALFEQINVLSLHSY